MMFVNIPVPTPVSNCQRIPVNEEPFVATTNPVGMGMLLPAQRAASAGIGEMVGLSKISTTLVALKGVVQLGLVVDTLTRVRVRCAITPFVVAPGVFSVALGTVMVWLVPSKSKVVLPFPIL